MANIFFKSWRILSFGFLLAILLFCYVQLPDSVAVIHNEAGRPVSFMDKQNFFYLAVALILGINVLFGLLKGKALGVNFPSLAGKSEWASRSEQLKSLLSGWADAFPAVINTYLIFVLFGLYTTNRDVSQNLDRDYGWFLILGAVLLLVLLFYLPLRILFTSPRPE